MVSATRSVCSAHCFAGQCRRPCAATSTSCRRPSTSIRHRHGRRTHCCSRRAEPPMPNCWIKGGPTACARNTLRIPSIRSGTTSGTTGRRDSGLRIDHLLLSPALKSRLADAGVDKDVRGQPHASDHAPAWVKLRPSTKLGARKRKAPDTTAASEASPELAQTIGPAADAERDDHEVALGRCPETDDYESPTAGD